MFPQSLCVSVGTISLQFIIYIYIYICAHTQCILLYLLFILHVKIISNKKLFLGLKIMLTVYVM